MKGQKKICHANGIQKRAGVPTFISDKTDLKSKNVTGNQEGYCIMIKGLVHQKYTITNIYMYPTSEHLNISKY